MHVRIAWEIYNHQQKQKGDKKPGDNPGLVPSTSSVTASGGSTGSGPATAAPSSLSSKTPTSLPLTKSSIAPPSSAGSSPSLSGGATSALPPPPLPHVGQKRPASGAPPIDFMHKRAATDSAVAAEHLLRNQMLSAMARPPGPHHFDPLSNPLLQRPPYLPPFGQSPLRKFFFPLIKILDLAQLPCSEPAMTYMFPIYIKILFVIPIGS